MKALSALCHLRRHAMVWFAENLISPAVRWLWRGLYFCFTVLKTLPRFVTRLPLPWRKDVGNEAERKEENSEPVRSFPESVEECHGYRQHDKRAENRASGCPEHDEFTAEEYRVKTTDEFYCSYDSTWETEESHESPPFRGRRSAGYRYSKFSRFESAARDMQNYRHGYPNQNRMQHWGNKGQNEKPNLNFYQGFTPSLPDGIYISKFHNEWYGKYDILEYMHTYIQWLFPLEEPGMNHKASTLTKDEIQHFLKSKIAMENLLKSYKLMLDFYGMKLVDERTGEVERADNWVERFNNLNSHTHNNLRITRILKCLGTLGYQRYQAPLVQFFLEETLVQGELPNVKDSVLNYFLFAVLDKRERRKLIKFAYLNYLAEEEFVWCPKKIQMLWSRPDESKHQMNIRKGVHAGSPPAECYSSDEELETANQSMSYY